MKILIADDEQPKLTSIVDWISVYMPNAEICTSRSVRTTIAAALEFLPDLVLLDMSLPTFDIAAGETGGRPQGFGGVEVMRNIEFYEVKTKVIVITQYEAFPDNGKHVDLREMRERLVSQHPDIFIDCLRYNAVSDSWKTDLSAHLELFAGG